MFEIGGCTDVFACNFMILATDNDGSCAYANSDEDCVIVDIHSPVSNTKISNTEDN